VLDESGGGLTPDFCYRRANECRALISQTTVSRARVMLEHIAQTWERVAQRLIDKD
jgi:hypothetical protein